MVEKIIVNPSEVRGLGDILEVKSTSDFTLYGSTLSSGTDTVYGATQNVMTLTPKQYNVSFKSATYTTSSSNVNVQVSVLDGTTPVGSGTVYVTGCGGSGSGNIGFDVQTGTYFANVTVTGITGSGTLTANYKGSKATATLTYSQVTYTLQFSQDTYTVAMLDGVTVSCTLTNGGTPMSGETITFTYDGTFGPETVTATTNVSGVATKWFEYFDFGTFPVTVTATYQGVTATCSVVEG